MEDELRKILDFAKNAHGSQQRKYSGEPFINHPLRVMAKCREHLNDKSILSAAILHDVLEDTDIGKEEMKTMLTQIMDADAATKTFDLVVELTDVFTKEKFPHDNRKKRKAKEKERIAQTSSDAQTIKYADIIDNVGDIQKHDPEFASVFLNECKSLLSVIREGDENLWKEAKEKVDKNLEKLKQ